MEPACKMVGEPNIGADTTSRRDTEKKRAPVLLIKTPPRASCAMPGHAIHRSRGHALAVRSPIYDSRVQRKSDANDGLGAPITVPVTACATGVIELAESHVNTPFFSSTVDEQCYVQDHHVIQSTRPCAENNVHNGKLQKLATQLPRKRLL
eukprot:COSAG02_NODE_9251_length_2277_cov_2.493572_2_plen_151_part_00